MLHADVARERSAESFESDVVRVKCSVLQIVVPLQRPKIQASLRRIDQYFVAGDSTFDRNVPQYRLPIRLLIVEFSRQCQVACSRNGFSHGRKILSMQAKVVASVDNRIAVIAQGGAHR